MTTGRWRLMLVSIVAILLIVLGVAASQLPGIGAGGLLHPARRRVVQGAPSSLPAA